jgi:hypothetical protein
MKVIHFSCMLKTTGRDLNWKRFASARPDFAWFEVWPAKSAGALML